MWTPVWSVTRKPTTRISHMIVFNKGVEQTDEVRWEKQDAAHKKAHSWWRHPVRRLKYEWALWRLRMRLRLLSEFFKKYSEK